MADEPKAKPGAMLGNAAALGLFNTGAGVVAGAATAMQSIKDAAVPEQSIGQQLIAGGGARQDSNAIPHAVVSALNRIAGLKSRL